jgi:hypothetical protein
MAAQPRFDWIVFDIRSRCRKLSIIAHVTIEIFRRPKSLRSFEQSIGGMSRK